MNPISVNGFERKFLENIDPWDYTHSKFEHFKRRILVRACGLYKHGRGLDIGCAIGETTHCLAPFCMSLVGLDASATALKEARRRLGVDNRIALVKAVVPEKMPHGPFDLIVVSEIAYYLPAHKLFSLGRKVIAALAPRGRIVILHHRRFFEDAAQLSGLAHRRLYRQMKKTLRIRFAAAYPGFDIVTFEKPSPRRVARPRQIGQKPRRPVPR